MLAAVVFIGAMLTACGDQQAQTQTRRTTKEAPRSGGKISPLLSSNFALLRTPPDGISPAARQTLAASDLRVSWGLARRIPVAIPGRYWLVPGPASICVVAATPGSPAIGAVCASVSQALHHGVASTSLDQTSGRRVIVGVVPIGTRTVLVRSGATTSSAHVFHGHFALRDSVAAAPDVLVLR